MKQTADKAKNIRWASDPRLNVNIDKVLIPLDEILEVSDVKNVALIYCIEIQKKTNSNHAHETGVACDFVLHVEEDEK
jgi:hypothetical protein